MEIAGLPLHPLVVHAAVVLIPLTALLTIGLAVLPRWRWLLRWPTAGASVLCIVLAYVATTSGGPSRAAGPSWPGSCASTARAATCWRSSRSSWPWW